MARKRNPENKGLPARWRFTRNAYYYQVPPGCEHEWDGKMTFKLGKTLSEAYRTWADRIDTPFKVHTIGELLDHYASKVVPTKAPKTQKGNNAQIEQLRLVFGTYPLKALVPRNIYEYHTKRGAKVSARREIALLSHAYTKAVEWGFLDRHPFKGEIRLQKNKPRTRYVTDDEIAACLALTPKRKRDSVEMIQAYIRLKLLTGLRRGDMLRLKIVDLKANGIHVTTNKTGKPIIYQWTDALLECIEGAKAVRLAKVSPYLFCSRRGKSYLDEATGEASGWNSMWKRFMERLIEEEKIKERFTEHDIRAKTASDASSLEHARAMLAHADSRITEQVYRRKPEMVMPAK